MAASGRGDARPLGRGGSPHARSHRPKPARVYAGALFLIAEAVRAVARGEVRWFAQPGEQAEVLDELTEREHEILRLLAEGHANQEIAEHLHISEHIVRSHATSLYDKLGVSSGRKTIAWASQSGLMSRR